VTVFEGGIEQVYHVRETVELSRVDDRVDVRHAIVGPDEEVYGETDQAQFIDPAELLTCDVLVLDCEGAETAILEGISRRPRTIIVETHHMYDAPASVVRTVLRERGYEVVTERLEMTPYGELPVLTADYRGEETEESDLEHEQQL
jgi:hypothetical protein